MRNTTILWPEDVLGCPLRSQYKVGVDAAFVRTEVEDGPARYQRMKQEERREVDVSFLWTLAQLEEFELFHRDQLLDGMRWFMMPTLTGRGMQPMFCHILEGYTIQPNNEALKRYEVAFRVEGYHSSTSEPPPAVFNVPVDAGTAGAVASDEADATDVVTPLPIDVYDAASPGQVA
jgi:hypothetical protein